jgi:hypothetical protein
LDAKIFGSEDDDLTDEERDFLVNVLGKTDALIDFILKIFENVTKLVKKVTEQEKEVAQEIVKRLDQKEDQVVADKKQPRVPNKVFQILLEILKGAKLADDDIEKLEYSTYPMHEEVSKHTEQTASGGSGMC